MYELVGFDYVILAFCAAMVGFTKTGVPGLLVLVVPLMASILPARSSVGVLLGILILADVFAAAYYRHQVLWRHIFRLLPVSVAGIVIGYFGLRAVNDAQLEPIIGLIILVMLGLNAWRTKAGEENHTVPSQWWFAAGAGFMAGVVTMMANLAGPIMIIYMIAMRVPKIQFVGTSAWYFLIVNWVKVPFSANLELMTWESAKLNVIMVPFILIGALTGTVILRHIPMKAFNIVVQVLAAVASIKLLF